MVSILFSKGFDRLVNSLIFCGLKFFSWCRKNSLGICSSGSVGSIFARIYF